MAKNKTVKTLSSAALAAGLAAGLLVAVYDGSYLLGKIKSGQFYDGARTVIMRAFCFQKAKGLDELVMEHGKHHRVAAEKNGYRIDPRLSAAVEFAESSAISCFVGKKYEKSVMQLSDEVIESYQIKDPFDVKENISGGYRHLMKLMKDNGGFVRLAIASYNAGQMAVYRAITNNQKAIREKAEKMPTVSKENIDRAVYEIIKKDLPPRTREYVPKVMDTYEKLKAVYDINMERKNLLQKKVPRHYRSK